MKITLIIVTYNWKTALRSVLTSITDQTVFPSEIIITDDGSTDGTDVFVENLKDTFPVPIIFLRQENIGFRAARCRNRAIAAASGDFIILIDGDVLLERHCIEDHSTFAVQGYFNQGTRVLLNEEITARQLLHFDRDIGLLSKGIENRKNTFRSQLLSTIFSKKSTRLRGIKTCNFSFFRNDAMAVNGFNEDFVGWGREDSEFAVRLMNKGVSRKNIKFRAIVYHLFHEHVSRHDLDHNDKILENAIRTRTTWCDNGISNHLSNK